MSVEDQTKSKAGEPWIRRSKIPEWLREQYSEYLAEAATRDWSTYDDVDASFSDRNQFYDRIVYNSEGKEFWDSMGRRRHVMDDMTREEFGGDYKVNHVELLLEMAWIASRGCSSLERMSARNRAKTGRLLMRRSSQLIEDLSALKEMIAPEYSTPMELKGALSSDAFAALEAVKLAGEMWARSDSVVKRPSVAGAEIIFFVRTVGAYFNHFHDQNLYAATASLASCVYGAGITEERVREILRA